MEAHLKGLFHRSVKQQGSKRNRRSDVDDYPLCDDDIIGAGRRLAGRRTYLEIWTSIAAIKTVSAVTIPVSIVTIAVTILVVSVVWLWIWISIIVGEYRCEQEGQRGQDEQGTVGTHT